MDSLDILSQLFDKNFLAELTSEDTWLDRLRRVIERGDKQGFELMGRISILCGPDCSARRLHTSGQLASRTCTTTNSSIEMKSQRTAMLGVFKIPLVTSSHAKGHLESR